MIQCYFDSVIIVLLCFTALYHNDSVLHWLCYHCTALLYSVVSKWFSVTLIVLSLWHSALQCCIIMVQCCIDSVIILLFCLQLLCCIATGCACWYCHCYTGLLLFVFAQYLSFLHCVLVSGGLPLSELLLGNWSGVPLVFSCFWWVSMYTVCVLCLFDCIIRVFVCIVWLW